MNGVKVTYAALRTDVDLPRCNETYPPWTAALLFMCSLNNQAMCTRTYSACACCWVRMKVNRSIAGVMSTCAPVKMIAGVACRCALVQMIAGVTSTCAPVQMPHLHCFRTGNARSIIDHETSCEHKSHRYRWHRMKPGTQFHINHSTKANCQVRQTNASQGKLKALSQSTVTYLRAADTVQRHIVSRVGILIRFRTS